MTPFELRITASPEDIDELGHVNNAAWVRWIQDVATAHWYAIAPAQHRDAYVWVVTRHEIDYLRALGPGEWPEWGNPITDKAAFEYIRSYSPYDQVKAQAYPPMLITGGLNDPRVTYWEPAKWAAKLRATKTDDNLLLLKINMGAGHGGKSGRWDRLHEVAEAYAFVLTQIGDGR